MYPWTIPKKVGTDNGYDRQRDFTDRRVFGVEMTLASRQTSGCWLKSLDSPEPTGKMAKVYRFL